METPTTAGKRRLFQLLFGFAAAITLFFALIFTIFGHPFIGLVVGLGVAAAWIFWAWFKADQMILNLCSARPADEVDHARLFNTTNGLCAAMGLTPPELYVVDDRALNALAVGRDDRNASLVVTRGLHEETSLVELEAAVALALQKVKANEIALGTMAVATVGASWVLSERFDQNDFLRRFFALPNGLVKKVLVSIHPSRAEIDTDIAAVLVTRFPPALASLLSKMSGRTAMAKAAPVTALMWIAAPTPPAGTSDEEHRLHLPLDQRIAVLQEL